MYEINKVLISVSHRKNYMRATQNVELRNTVDEGLALLNWMEAGNREKPEQYLNGFFEFSLDMMCIAGTDGYYKRVSRSFERVLGYSTEELLSRPLSYFQVDDEAMFSYKDIKIHHDGGREFRCERRFRCKSGEVKWLAWKSVLLSNENLIYAVARDITEEKAAEQKLKEYNDCLQKYKEENLQSLRYAGSLQRALLPEKKELKNHFPESFIFYAPKQIVSGDFYWFEQFQHKFYVAAADCTGHGVPGAMLSVLGMNIIQNALNVEKLTAPALLLRKLDGAIYKMFSRKREEHLLQDGMDISICVIDKETNTMEYSGTNNPVYIVRQGELLVIKPEKYSLGSYQPEKVFETQQIALETGDVVYLFTDGYADQFGGHFGKKLGYRKFKELLLEVSKNNITNYESFISDTLKTWSGEQEQVDDILLMGIRI